MISLLRFRNSRGFTMIELLVVIAVIGVLAVAVLSAINPIEQINKGKDTRARSDAAELLGSIERYYSTQELFPWNVVSTDSTNNTDIPANNPADGGNPDTDPDAAYVAGSTADTWNFLGSLVESNEVKPAFGQRMFTAYGAQDAGDEEFLVLKDDSTVSDAVHVCFMPTSRQFKLEAAKRCCADDTAGICTSAGNLVGQQPTTIGGETVCVTTNGAATWTTDRNFICLP